MHLTTEEDTKCRDLDRKLLKNQWVLLSALLLGCIHFRLLKHSTVYKKPSTLTCQVGKVSKYQEEADDNCLRILLVLGKTNLRVQ